MEVSFTLSSQGYSGIEAYYVISATIYKSSSCLHIFKILIIQVIERLTKK